MEGEEVQRKATRERAAKNTNKTPKHSQVKRSQAKPSPALPCPGRETKHESVGTSPWELRSMPPLSFFLSAARSRFLYPAGCGECVSDNYMWVIFIRVVVFYFILFR